MATGKDRVDAFAFARRRMVANLVVPAPTGSDEGAPRPVRAFLTSAILSVMAVAAVALLGAFRPSAPGGWENGLAVDSTSGAAYIYSPQDKELHPVVNITSAKLLLGTGFAKYDVPDDVINGSVTIGAPFGILGAPTDVPTASNVDLTQWNVCVQAANPADQTASTGTTVLEIGYGRGQDTAAPASDGFIVHDSGDDNYLIDGGYAYQIADYRTVNGLDGVSIQSGAAAGPWVSTAWLNAFEKGGPIRFPTVSDVGGPVTTALSGHPAAQIGDYGSLVENGATVGYIETGQGLVEVNDFVYRLYVGGPSALASQQMTLNQAQVNSVPVKDELGSASSLAGASGDWPRSQPTVLDADGATPGFGVLCAAFDGQFSGDVPQLGLYYGTRLPHLLAPGEGEQVSAGPSYPNVIDVLPGHAALIRSVSGGLSVNSGTEYLVPGTGVKYEMTPAATVVEANGQSTQTSAAKQLQYTNVTVEPVPQNLTGLLETGAPLDPAEAGKTPALGTTQ